MSTPYDYITINTPSGGISTTYTGTEINFNTPAISDVTKAEVAFTAKQTLNGYSAPWPGGAGKNLLLNTATTQTRNGVTFTFNADGSVKVNGTATANASVVLCDMKDFLTEAGTYTLSGCPSGGGNGKYKIECRVNSSSSWYGDDGNGVQINYVVNQNINQIRIIVYSGFTANNLMFYPMLEKGSTKTTFAPYENICPITGSSSVTLYKRASSGGTYQYSYYKYLNSTVYNGSFEYITGKVTKTYVSVTLNSTNQSWSVYNNNSTSRAFRATISDMKSLSHSSYDSARCFCTHASWTTSSERLGFGKFYYSYGYVYFPDYSSKRFNTVDEFTAWLDLQESRGTPVTILYPLSTPTETTLSTTTIKTLAGQNYFDTSSTAANRSPITMTIQQTSFNIPRPANFNVQREDIYAGEYITCTGATKADRIGWKYSDLDLEWDALEQGYVEALIALTGQATLIFDDPEHDTIEESIVRSSAVATRHRSTLNGVYWWTDVKCSIRFIDAHND